MRNAGSSPTAGYRSTLQRRRHLSDVVSPEEMNLLLESLQSLSQGNFSSRLPATWTGAAGKVAEAFNEIAMGNDRLAHELNRLGQAVGKEGRFRERASLNQSRGAWGEMEGSVNALVEDLVRPTAEITQAISAVAEGSLSRTVRLEVDGRPLEGDFLHAAKIVNTMIQQLGVFTSEVTRVAREVGTEGKLGGQAHVPGAAGTWKDLTDSVNSMADNLTGQVRNIGEVATAVASGDLSRKITVDVRGEILQLKEAINSMVDQLRSFASEVTRVAREVGTEGKLGGQAVVPGVAGTWKDLTDSVNAMAGNLTAQVRNIAAVTTAVARGDLSRKITVDVKGELLELKDTINTMVDQLNGFAGEVTRVAREVGTEGKLGGQAEVPAVGGIWKDLTDSVNSMASNLTGQVRNIAGVAAAIAHGDLSRKITVDVRGEILELKETLNTTVDQLNRFAGEVTRVSREVGTEGRLGGQANVPGAAGTWKDLTDSVNFMAGNLTDQVRNIAEVTTAVARGDLSRKITVDVKGEILELKNTINTMVDQLNSFSGEVTRVAREVGTEGKLGGQAEVPGAAGTWKDLTDNVNFMAANLTGQVRNIAEVATAVARGDLSRKITVDVKGEILELKNTINTMVDQLNSFSVEVTRVAREVGTDGKLGGQARIPGAAGIWKDLTDNVNSMAANLTGQVRNIAEVATAIANGDLSKKITVHVSGEILELKNTINTMVDQLNSFSVEVTRVAREVGSEGRLGGQANVPGVAGVWKALTGNVNLLAENLTNQVRAIAEVATAVTEGDLTRSIQVEAKGEVSDLKDNINTMITNLRLTTEHNNEQDWLKTNLARISSMLQGQRDLKTVGNILLSEIAPLVNAHQAVIYQMTEQKREGELSLLCAYAGNGLTQRIAAREGLVGQCAAERRRILITDIPRGNLTIRSGLLEAAPRNIVVLPVLFEGHVKAVMELASLSSFTDAHLSFLDQLTSSLGIVLNSIETTMRTEQFLEQSQELANELQAQQKELQQTNDKLAQKAQQLAEQNVEVERKNQEIEQARLEIEGKAKELALTSKYKSEFLANMSHELRTPLNSVLVLAQQLGENSDRNLTAKQIEFARTIYSAGTDLLNLITDILDLSKIESGTVSITTEEVFFSTLLEGVARQFRHDAESRGLKFTVFQDPRLAPSFVTDSKRLQQILKNLLSNAIKFTSEGGIELAVSLAENGWSADHPILSCAGSVVAFSVKDSGIGIPREKQQLIFEAFQQAEAGTSRKYGGTGLGLAISRELSGLLGGEIQLRSEPRKGSTFTVYLPWTYPGLEKAASSFTPELEPELPLPPDEALVGKKVLVVDDDVRNIFALSSVLERQGMSVITADSGKRAIAALESTPDISLSLVDIMMPEMDGYETIRAIRRNSLFAHMPIVALTAKAMNGDREKTLAAGASEYLAKPVDTRRLLSTLHVWLHG